MVHRDNIRPCAAALRIHLTAQRFVHAVDHHFMEHHAVPSEHELDPIARPQFLDQRRGDAGAHVLLLPVFAGPLGHGANNVPDGVGEDIAGFLKCVHWGLPVMGWLKCQYI